MGAKNRADFYARDSPLEIPPYRPQAHTNVGRVKLTSPPNPKVIINRSILPQKPAFCPVSLPTVVG